MLWNGVDHPIDCRRIRMPSGQLNLTSDIPQNSFRSIAAKLVGGADRLSSICVLLEKSGVRSRESDGIFVLSPPAIDDAKRICHVRIVVPSGFKEFDRLAADRGGSEAPCCLALAMESDEN
jgi:hypothetical protein